MRIERVEIARVELPLIAPYEIATERIERVENLFVQIVTDRGHVGLGCAAPDETVTGETHDRCADGLEVAGGLLAGRDPLLRVAALDAVSDVLRGCPSARAGLDLALHDLLGKVAGVPVYRLIGGVRTSMPTSITVFLERPEVMAEKSADFVRQGFRALKLKGGRNVDADIEVVHRVRAAVGPDIELRFDANQGWTAAEALRFLAAVGDAELELLEQPTPRGHAESLGRVTRHAAIPVMADESLHDLYDAFRLARADRVDMVNVKVMKVGGLDAALQINAVARAAELELMVGCSDECALAIAGGLALALGRPNVAYADLDGHLDLAWDPTADAVGLAEGGVLLPNEGPGFGLERLRVFE